MSFISKNNLILAGLVWGICLAVFVPAYFFVIQKQYSDLGNIESSIKELREELNRAKIISSEKEMDKYRNQVEEIKNVYNGFVIPSKDDIQELASIEIDRISREIGLEAFRIDPWSSNEIAAFSECKYVFGQPMEVTFNSTFNEFAKFINMLERYKSVIFIEKFSITRSKDKNTKHQVRMDLGVLVQKQASLKG